ncbi:hypothetical protein GE09DRAFT_102462 [Coniochaeta sp. 2T2.1]|nr:hypothetical protein GE09DRAFT_102462 [Coniochaeta sp. 2T2.1]
MRATITPGLLALVAASSTVSAQQQTNQSAPFALQIANAANASLNGVYLFACHAGAAIEGLCLSDVTPNYDFFFNTTDTNNPDDSQYTDPSHGQLVWNLPISNNPEITQVSEPLNLQSYSLGTNVIAPLFMPQSSNTVFRFADDNKLTIVTSYNDADLQAGVFPPSSPNQQFYTWNNWYICWGNVGVSYYYEALNWVTAGEPHNPTCQKVDVVRVFAP